MKHFSIDGEWGTLLPYRGGLRFRIPSWVSLIFAIPFVALFAAAFLAGSVPLQLFSGFSGGLFIALWFMSRRVSHDAGLIRINRNTSLAHLTERDGSETRVHFRRFLAIKLERVVLRGGYTWMAVLCGDEESLILDMGYSFQRSLLKRVAPVADWLDIPTQISTENVSFIALIAKPDFRTNPYSSLKH